MGNGQVLRPTEPANPPGFLYRIVQRVIEEKTNSFTMRLKYPAEYPAILNNKIHPQLYELFIQKLNTAFESGPMGEPSCACSDSDYFKPQNNRRDMIQQVCNGANQNIFGPVGMRVVPNYRIIKEMFEGREVHKFYHLVDICENISTVVQQTVHVAPAMSTSGGVQYTQDIAVPTNYTPAYQQGAGGAIYQATPANGIAVAQPTFVQPGYTQQAYAQAPYQTQQPMQPQPMYAQPTSPVEGHAPPAYAQSQAQPYPQQQQQYPAQAYQQQQPQQYPAQSYAQPQAQAYPAQPYQQQQAYQAYPVAAAAPVVTTTTHTTHTIHVIPTKTTFNTSGNAASEQGPLMMQ